MALLPLVLLLLAAPARAGPVVGPGSLTSYGGPPQQSRWGGLAVVQDPALGFFIAGSSIDAVNGVYGRVHQVPVGLQRHTFMLAYMNDVSGMLLALVEGKQTPEGSQWLLIDAGLRDRFASPGGGILPGAGIKWRHLHREASAEKGDEVARLGSDDGDWDEYPWQVVGIMGEEMLKNLRSHIRFREETIRAALRGAGLPSPRDGDLEGVWREGSWIYRVADPGGVPVRSRPTGNSTQVGSMKAGEFVRATLRRGGFLRLDDRGRWGKQPCWAMAVGPGSEHRLVLVPEEEAAGAGLSLEHEGPAVDDLDRPSAPALVPPSIQALPPGGGPEGIGAEPNRSGANRSADGGGGAGRQRAPHDAGLAGAPGPRAARALHLALGYDSQAAARSGVAALRRLLADAIEERDGGEGQSSSSALAALILRLALVRALLKQTRDSEALQEAEAAVQAAPLSPAALLFLACCELRSGQREEALLALERAAGLGPGADVYGAWGHAGAAARLRSLRAAERLRRRAEEAHALAADFQAAAALYADALSAAREVREDKWGRAMLHADRAVCLRRLRLHGEALGELDAALRLFPRYKRALFRRGMVLLEVGRPAEGITAFETLLRLDRKWPKLSDWLVRAHMLSRRAARAKGAAAGSAEDALAEDYYALLGVSVDFTLEELKQAFRKASLKYHPDKAGGSEQAFQRAAAAYETLGNPELRRRYDEGQNLNNLVEEVERRYFPERYQFLPFGDPFEGKRRLQAFKQHGAGGRAWREGAWDL